MIPGLLEMIGTLGSGLFGFASGKQEPQMAPEQRDLLRSQQGLTETENALQQLILARKRQQDPMFRAVQQMAFSRLPWFAKQGINFDMTDAGQAPGTGAAGSRPRGDNPMTGIARQREY